MISHLLIHALALSIAEAALVKRWSNGTKPSGIVDSGAAEGCVYWANEVEEQDTCSEIIGYFGISESQFNRWVSLIFLRLTSCFLLTHDSLFLESFVRW